MGPVLLYGVVLLLHCCIKALVSVSGTSAGWLVVILETTPKVTLHPRNSVGLPRSLKVDLCDSCL